MINNRQGGRRRGRGGQRGQNLGGQPGNRQDNRQRGNAAQLLEKYKSMARDAQLAGDRVQTEYFLQFADHYFRVLSESRARFEDQRPRRDHEADEDEGEEEVVETAAGESSDGDRRPERQERFNRRDRQRRPEGDEPSRGNQQAREADEPDRMNGGETIPFDVLPPAIGREDDEAGEVEDVKPRRVRRSRAARPSDSDDEIAPAA